MISNTQENNKRIAKNTMALYFRMFVIMAVSLYTSRIILQTLGVDDYGIYNVVGGIVSMLGVINGVVSAGASRFINFALGRDDKDLAREYFNVNLMICYGISLIVVVLAETVGLWFLNTQLVIPNERIVAANWVFQFTIVSAVNNILAIPYNSTIIAREKMNAFAYISIIEVIIKLLIVYLLSISPTDRLIAYGFLMMMADLLIREIYRIYSRKHFVECKFKLYRNKKTYSEILTFSGWNIFGSTSIMVKGQGLNVLLNMFFPPAVNAARGIAYQINTAINQFISNFYTAVRPQITKYYARGELDNMFNLVFRSSKLSIYMILLLALPVIIETPCIIDIWLGQTPDYVISFVRLIIVISVFEGMSQPLMTTCMATGKIALYQSLVGTMIILNIPISYVFLKLGYQPLTVFVVSLIIAIVCHFTRIAIVKYLLPEFKAWAYITKVMINSTFVALIALIAPVASHCYLSNSIFSSIVTCVICVISVCVTIYIIGLNSAERNYLLGIIKKKTPKFL